MLRTASRFVSLESHGDLARMIHNLVGWDKQTAIWWAGACELTFPFDWMWCWVRLPFPPAHHGLTHAGPTLLESSGLVQMKRGVGRQHLQLAVAIADDIYATVVLIDPAHFGQGDV